MKFLQAHEFARLYTSHNLVRLDQILVSKLLSVPLKEMAALLNRSREDIAATLGLQRRALLERRRQLNMTVRA